MVAVYDLNEIAEKLNLSVKDLDKAFKKKYSSLKCLDGINKLEY